ncbi:hypothetical protein CEXT_530031 [Caerostris extrusa]|uniref:G-protein coupled receptors family 1 profile domain-containing protein n=1 Tax=Caerostris extrusa TaxID=172846 RepID=A0AAV4Q7R5_CAEEX|nr:hypothetical protein CEXT_530031 [Caerostris extrusa]
MHVAIHQGVIMPFSATRGHRRSDRQHDHEPFEDYRCPPGGRVHRGDPGHPHRPSNTIIGNVLVIISVFTYRPLQNMFIVSLAVADIVAVLVMPLKSRLHPLMSQWKFGLPLCKDVAHVRRPVLHGLHPAPPPSPWTTGTGRSTIHQLRQREDSEERNCSS